MTKEQREKETALLTESMIRRSMELNACPHDVGTQIPLMCAVAALCIEIRAAFERRVDDEMEVTDGGRLQDGY
jgi:hypothetical protein